MDTLEKQVIMLNHKVDTLYEVIREMNLKISESLSQAKPSESADTVVPEREKPMNRVVFSPSAEQHSQFEHKDVLLDDNYAETNVVIHREETNITADIQIQRLTAQLTAAYNRIAALEERLLSQRSPTSSQV